MGKPVLATYEGGEKTKGKRGTQGPAFRIKGRRFLFFLDLVGTNWLEWGKEEAERKKRERGPFL